MTAPTASIDDLLGYEEESAPAERRSESVAAWTFKSILVAAGLTAVIAFALRLYDIEPPYPMVFAGLFALLALRRVVSWVAPPPARTRHHRLPTAADDGLYSWGPRDALESIHRRWDSRLARAKGEPDRFAQRVQPMLRDIVDERLRLRYGLTLSADPAKARAVLGEPLWTFLTEPPARAPGPRELTVHVAQIERLNDRHAGIRHAPRTRPTTDPHSQR